MGTFTIGFPHKSEGWGVMGNKAAGLDVVQDMAYADISSLNSVFLCSSYGSKPFKNCQIGLVSKMPFG